MGMLVCVGRDANVFATASVVTPSTAMNTLFPIGGLTDGVPGVEAAFNAAAAGQNWTFDLALSGLNGGMEGTWPASNGANVSTGTGAAVQSATFVKIGAASTRCTGGASGVGRYRLKYSLRTGFRYRLSVWGRNTTTATCKVQIINAETGRYLQVGGASWGAAVDCVTTATTTFVEMTVGFTVESWATCGNKDRAEIWVEMYCSQNEFVYFDELQIWPELDLVAVLGHNIDVANGPQIRTSTDNFGAVDTLAATMTPQRPAFFSKLVSSITRRYVRITFPLANVAGAPKLGELFGGQYRAPARGVSAVVGEAVVSIDRPQIVSDFQTFSLADFARTSLALPMHLLTSANHKELRDEIVGRSAGSLYPVVIAPDDVLEGDLVVMGRLGGAQAYKRMPVDQRETSLVIEGLPYATVVS